MVSSPTRKGSITLSIDVAPGGIGSQWLRALKLGDAVHFKGPTGGFVFNRADPRRAALRGRGDRHRADPLHPRRTSTRPATAGSTGLIYWARDPSLARSTTPSSARSRAATRRFSYLPGGARGARDGWRGEKGEPADAVERLVHSVDRLVVYVCGGGETIQKVRDVLVRKGMDRKSVKWEKFW